MCVLLSGEKAMLALPVEGRDDSVVSFERLGDLWYHGLQRSRVPV